MKTVKVLALLLILFISCSFNQAMGGNAQRIAILPFESEGVDTISIKTAREILKVEIQRLTDAEVFLANNTNHDSLEMTDLQLALQSGKRVQADQVVTCKFLTLGQKLIIQYSIIDVALGKTLFYDSINSLSLEELDVVMKRIAAGLMQRQTVNKTAETGMIVENESRTPLSRSGRNFYSFSFGYLFPISDDLEQRSFTMDYRLGSELSDNFEYGMQLFARSGFGANIFSSLLATKQDFCPYLGAGIGFHWLTGLKKYNEPIWNSNGTYGYYTYAKDDRKEDGLEIVINGGIKLFNTYNFRIGINGTYSHTFNDFNTNTFIFTIGFIH